MTQEYKLDGLCCANCAMKIEKNISKIDRLEDVSLNFATQTLSMEVEDSNADLVKMIQKEVDKVEDGITVSMKMKDHVHHHVDEAIHDHHDHDHGHSHSHEHGGDFGAMTWVRLAVGAVLFLVGIFGPIEGTLEIIIYLTGYVIVGGDVLVRAVKNILRGQIFDENFLMALATVGAILIKEYPEAVTVMLFYQIGELFQDLAVNRSRKSIASLMDIRPDSAWLKENGNYRQVAAASVSIGDTIVVKPGERVPLDGVVSSGASLLDTSALTGESVPRRAEVGDTILSGSVNQEGLIEVEVTKGYSDSTVARILELVESATNKKAPTEKFITKFARYYTPTVVGLAAILAFIPPIILEGATFSDWIHRALIFLVVSCPCALVLSIPLSFFGGIGGASKRGILIKGSNYLEALDSIETVVFDKTGTLTKGIFSVSSVKPVAGVTKNYLLKLAASLEVGSNHPIAKSIVSAYNSNAMESVGNFKEIPGFGVTGEVSGYEVAAGNMKLMNQMNVKLPNSLEIEKFGTAVYIAENGKFKGQIIISDAIKEDSQEAVKALRKIGVKKIVMLTGDHKHVADAIGNRIGIDEIRSELLPEDKVLELESIMEQSKGKTIFVGDGINDAPVLARADIGVAMGGIGSDAAIEAADLVLMTDEPSKLVDAISISKRTRNIVWQNIIFAIGVKVLVLILGAGGLATMWEAVFADVGVALIAIFNAMRIIYKK